LIQKDTNDSKLLTLISDKFKDLVLNDKEKLNDLNLKYFIPFLRISSLETFKSNIFPEIEFLLKRNGNMIPVIADVVNNLVSLKFDSEIISMLTT
jgi:hypothetical protein